MPRPAAPYHHDPALAAQGCFDRLSGESIPSEQLKTYRQALAQYHLHPEAKFAHADYADRGPTERRHIVATCVTHIGKEANRWEEQLYLGMTPEAQIDYGATPDGRQRMVGSILRAGQRFGQRALAEAAGMSSRAVGAVLRGDRKPTREALAKLCQAIPTLEVIEREDAEHAQEVVSAVRKRCEQISVRQFAAIADVHYPHLTEVLNSRRQPSPAMLASLEAAIMQAKE